MTLTEKLEQAENEYHALVTGIKPKVIIDQNGEKVEFTSTNRAALQSYIQTLRKKLKHSQGGNIIGVYM